MSYGSSLGITLPTIDGVATEAQAAPLINTALQTIIDVLESKVQPSGMDINADLSFKSGGSYFGAKDLQRSAYTSLAAALSAGTYPGTVYRVGTDLYYNDGDGNQIQITAGGQVNIASSGGITGAGYGTGGVEVNWDSVNSRFKVRNGAAADDYASLVLNDALFNDGSGNYATLGAPALAADYTMLLPAALPASGTDVVTLDSTGQLASTSTPTLAGATISGTLDISAADIVRGTRWQQIYSPTQTTGYQVNNSQAFKQPIYMDEGASLLQITILWKTNSANVKTLAIKHLSSDGTVISTNASTTTTSNTGGTLAIQTWNFTDISVTAPSLFGGILNSSGHHLWFEVSTTDSVAANLVILGVRVNYSPVF